MNDDHDHDDNNHRREMIMREERATLIMNVPFFVIEEVSPNMKSSFQIKSLFGQLFQIRL